MMAPFTIVKKAVEKLIRSRVETDYLGSWAGGELEVFIKREYATAENSRGQTKAYVKAILNDQDTRYKLTTQFAFADLNGAIFDMPKPKANPAPRKRAAKKSTPKSFDQFTKRQLQDFITGCHNARDYGPEFTAACYALNSQTTAPRKTNPAKRAPSARVGKTAKQYVSRPSQASGHKAPSKRLKARRKLALVAPKGYFPNPGKDEFLVQVCSPISVPLASRKWTTVLKFKTEKEAKETALQMARIDRLDRSWRVMKK